MLNDNYNTEEFVAKIAKLIETIPRDIEAKEISAIINDALANYIAEDDTNVVFFSKIIANSYIGFLEEYTDDPEEYALVIRIVTDFKIYIENYLQDLILKHLRSILLGEDNLNYYKDDEIEHLCNKYIKNDETVTEDFMNKPEGEENANT